ncbi:MAG: DNA topoisomerase IV subunit A [Alphaproteobacteria bacterium]|nr:DNA topoisomerase IV subunit A [Alphaproteobacteria bacterium]
MARSRTPKKPAGPERIVETPLADALSERYLAYAMSTIVSRSLPDVRDGLKPVHRRLLYAMRELKLNPDQGFKKCARVVGDVIGKYHPHGDVAVYDAMVRLAQDFAVRYPMVEGQGNFGNIDGDNAAAMRYTEARLTRYAIALMDGLDEDASDFQPTYDGEEHEPLVMPAAVPNLLANGSSGIAVGMATNIPPHNVGELCDALIHMADVRKKDPKKAKQKGGRPEILDATLLKYIPGPDFPTGGTLAESKEAIAEAYRTGRGSFRVRAKYEVEKHGRGQFDIVVTEMPYQVQKAKLIERIAELMDARKLPFLADIRDESAEDIRLVLEPKSRTVDPDTLMEQLFRQTDLEIRFGLNLNVLCADGVPRVQNLREVLQAYLDHRQEVLKRRSAHRLAKIEHRLEVLEGYLIAYLNLDEVIKIIRQKDEPKPVLMKRFKLTDVQAEAILNMRLRSLRKLEEMEIKGEHEKLTKEKKGLKSLLKDASKQWASIGEQLRAAKKEFGQSTPLGKRRTELGDAPSAVVVPIEALVEKEPITVVLSTKGWIRALKGHREDISDIKFKDGDDWDFSLQATTVDKILFFGSDGRFYTIPGDRLPQGRGFGEPLRLMVDLPNDATVVEMKVWEKDGRLLVASSGGRGFVVPEEHVFGQTKNGKQVLNLGKGEKARACHTMEEDDDHVAVVGKNRKLIIFPLEEMPEMTRGRGVILQRYKDGGLSDAKSFVLDEGLTWMTGGRQRTEEDLRAWMGKRAQAGRIAPRGFSTTNTFR